MAEYIERETFLKDIEERYCLPCKEAGEDYNGCRCRACWVDDMCGDVIDAPAADVEKMSDGYHTFADLYEQRLILSAALAKNNPNAWKSKRHEDGSVPFGGGWFIMGFDTDEGCYTYHYELKDWDLFQCKELDKGKPWDGHTSKDVRRLLSIPAADVAPVVRCKDCASTRKKDDYESIYLCDEVLICTNCEGGWQPVWPTNFCSYGCPRDGDDDA